MTQKELQRLTKPQLLKMMLDQTRRADRLANENSRLKERITDRERQLAQAGALAELALRLTPERKKGGKKNGDPDRASAVEQLEKVLELSQLQAEEIAREAEINPDDDGEDPEDEEPPPDYPTAEQLERELIHIRYRRNYNWIMRSTIFTLITVAAVAVLVAVLFMPVLQIYGSSMNPTLWEGDYVVSLKNAGMDTGDICAFYYNNRILVKRVIGQPGQWIDIAEDGTVYVDNVKIDEPYLTDVAFGECDIELPYQVPESRIFVMGDNRSVSVDSRSTTVGCVAEEQMVGKIVFRVWPLSEFGRVG